MEGRQVNGQEQKSSFQDAGAETSQLSERPGGPGGQWWKGAIVVALLAAIAATILFKSGKKEPDRKQSARDRANAFPPSEVLATVDGKPITLEFLTSELKMLPEQMREDYRDYRHDFLEDLIARRLLLGEAERLKLAESPEYKEALAGHEAHPGHEEEALLTVLLETRILKGIQVTDEELREFHQKREAVSPTGLSFETVRDSLRPILLQKKQDDAVEALISGLKRNATITRNQVWVNAQKALSEKNPLDVALSYGRPVVADFGRGKCIPCKMMKPIMEKLAKEFEGKAEILIIDIDDYPRVARRCRVRFIPLQVFFDSSGNEVYRHESFMPEEDIRAQLAKLGVE
jgi:thioredoxin 1